MGVTIPNSRLDTADKALSALGELLALHKQGQRDGRVFDDRVWIAEDILEDVVASFEALLAKHP